MIYKLETCKKCPRELCSCTGHVYEGVNFYIKAPCTNLGTFSSYTSGDLNFRDFLLGNYINNTDNLFTLIDALLNWHGLQLEDALQLTKIKSML